MSFFYYLLLLNLLFVCLYIYNYCSISKICKFILNKFNFKIKFSSSFNHTKLIMVSSHTSIYDFIIGVLFYYGYLHDKYNINILMKKDFEKMTTPLLKYFDNKINLISVTPHKQGLTDSVCHYLKDKNNYILYIAPEGTRKCTNQLKSGYWAIAKKLNIHIVYIGIDFMDKIIEFEPERLVAENWDDEKEMFIKSCRKYIPLYPERCYWTKDFYDN